MKTMLKLEEVGLFVGSLYLFSQLSFAWWWFPLLLLTPDVGMLGYLINSRMGAWTYNVMHHRLVGIVILLLGSYINNNAVTLAGVILLAHISFDRILGYGLKYEDSFHHTHLGTIKNTPSHL
ncbi:conserved hypothetical protein [Flavobacterium sp. 9AF]|uniref:DUF4260 domain-containing protein n=1 Tax=Flavobacterium sp. 9AF TaxID=2653142 RepID=UPI0012F3B429|nr:DUF4260 domain-containing protein [Flavobacterium sp. 9AF]VXB58356.1 conserved hypothetical protein [Flavobacterium sp. 9AF]